MKIRDTRALTVIGAALVLMIGGAVAYAAIPGAGGVITGCIAKSTGSVRVIDTAKDSCKSTETPLTWNQQGVPGTNGTNGTNGAAGQDGTDGTDGVSGFSVAFASVNWAASEHPPTNVVDAYVSCPPGTRVLGSFSRVQLFGPSGSGPLAPQSWGIEVVGTDQRVHFTFMDPVTRSNFTPGQQVAGEIYATCAGMN